ncbi:hypothetical protein IscW_ISCW013505 [Ixodes scapularis]|uniref:Salivary lipocalin n=1 Tax=Ixodes scapularis TaxID=6945 RepID=B7QFD6_IXOSC|nr:hypothetical protein IscW_ISCW013505 [Ixodes scapularis]|eukprot:XP_002414250.1 hypothetical protein IscW_ISCW013505 [Ixodes scapularis]
MFWQYILLVEAFIATDTLLAVARKDSEKRPEYNAWKFLKSFKSGYIKYQTYVDSVGCTEFLRKALNATDKSALYQVSFKVLADNTKETITLRFHEQITPNEYAVYNEDEEELYNSTVAYSDYSKCSIIQDSETPTNCKMFVNTGTSNRVIQECFKKFPDTCDSSRYDAFDLDICR